MEFEPRHPVPVFPLPSLVLFPNVQVPLHVFELRYRTMVRDALSGERLIAIALLKPGFERDYHGSPEFFPVGCLARFEEVSWLPNDCYDLRVSGHIRVRFERIVREYPYRAARVRLLPERPYSEDDPLVEMEKQALLETFGKLAQAAGEAAARVPGRDQPYRTAVNAMCMCTDAGPLERQTLLEMDDVIARGRQVRELTERRLQRRARRRPEGGEHN